MIKAVKKLGNIALILFYSFVLTTQVNIVSAASVNLCNSGDPNFGGLCNLNADSLGEVIPRVVIILLILAVVLAVVFLVWGGIKWILSGGDKGAVEQARGTIVAALVGLVIAFVAFFLVTFVAYLFGIDIGAGTSFELPRLVP